MFKSHKALPSIFLLSFYFFFYYFFYISFIIKFTIDDCSRDRDEYKFKIRYQETPQEVSDVLVECVELRDWSSRTYDSEYLDYVSPFIFTCFSGVLFLFYPLPLSLPKFLRQTRDRWSVQSGMVWQEGDMFLAGNSWLASIGYDPASTGGGKRTGGDKARDSGR